MNLLDLFKRKEKRKRLEKTAEEPKQVSASKPEVLAAEEKTLGKSKTASVILRKPRVTEKSSKLSEGGVYVFRVDYGSSKPEIKKAVEELYKVKVDRVNVINMPSRLRRMGRKVGRRPGYRKASVKLASGQKIEFV